MFDYYFTVDLSLSLFWTNFWNRSTFGKVTGKIWLPQVRYPSGHCPAEKWRTRLRFDVRQPGRQKLL